MGPVVRLRLRRADADLHFTLTSYRTNPRWRGASDDDEGRCRSGYCAACAGSRGLVRLGVEQVPLWVVRGYQFRERHVRAFVFGGVLVFHRLHRVWRLRKLLALE